MKTTINAQTPFEWRADGKMARLMMIQINYSTGTAWQVYWEFPAHYGIDGEILCESLDRSTVLNLWWHHARALSKDRD